MLYSQKIISSNVCNFKCRTCWHGNSSKWFEDRLILKNNVSEKAIIKAFNNEDASSTRKIYDEANRLNDLADAIRKAHLDRMKDGTCNALPALTFSDMAVALRRIKNHTVNLHEALFDESP